MLGALACTLLYFAIGREMIQLVRAKTGVTAMEVRADLHRVTKDVERIAQASRSRTAGESISPIAFTSAAALAKSGDPSDVDAWLADEPVEIRSRLR